MEPVPTIRLTVATPTGTRAGEYGGTGPLVIGRSPEAGIVIDGHDTSFLV